MMNLPAVTVMMPAFNAGRHIAAAIASLRAQSWTDWELIVVDDGSTDDTFHLASGTSDPRVTVVRQENRGEARSRNAALALARGRYVAFLDADDEFLPMHLARTVDVLEADPTLVSVFTDGVHITEDGRTLARLSSRRRPPRAGDVFEEVVYGSDFLGPPVCVVLRRSPIEAHDIRFDPAIVMGPDWDFFLRVSAHGPFGYLDEVTCRYRVHVKSITTSLDAQARRRERAKCRASAIGHPRFRSCSTRVRFNVFYDLLVVALRGQPDAQRAALASPAFAELPALERCRILRLMAQEAMVVKAQDTLVREWLRRARHARPVDPKTLALSALHSIDAGRCVELIRRRRGAFIHSIDRPPFEDLGIA